MLFSGCNIAVTSSKNPEEYGDEISLYNSITNQLEDLKEHIISELLKDNIELYKIEISRFPDQVIEIECICKDKRSAVKLNNLLNDGKFEEAVSCFIKKLQFSIGTEHCWEQNVNISVNKHLQKQDW